MEKIIVMNASDNVAIVMAASLPKKSRFAVGDLQITAIDEIPFAHKVAIKPIHKGEHIFKYGEPVGIATTDIAPGEHVHIHNVISGRHTVK